MVSVSSRVYIFWVRDDSVQFGFLLSKGTLSLIFPNIKIIKIYYYVEVRPEVSTCGSRMKSLKV